MRERPARVKSERCYDGKYIFKEIRLHGRALFLVEDSKFQDAQAVVRKSWQEILAHERFDFPA